MEVMVSNVLLEYIYFQSSASHMKYINYNSGANQAILFLPML